MASLKKKIDTKQGKKDPLLLAHQGHINTRWEAHRLEGKVKNRGIKNISRQKRKPAQPK
ncbi:MAG: hypothetical protein WAW00_03575 [Candidatus Moraniibacteriota bacterium]